MTKLSISYIDFKAIIWKVLPAADGQLCLELRDGTLRKTMLALVDTKAKKQVYLMDKLPKPWWIGLQAIYKEFIVLQGYKDSGSPEPLGVYILALKTGALFWKSEQVRFGGLDQKGNLLVVDENDQEQTIPIQLETLPEELEKNIQFPLAYTEESSHYSLISGFILDTFGHACSGPIDYWEEDALVVVAYYHQHQDGRSQLLAGVDGEGEVCLHETIMNEAQGVGTASFFIVDQLIIFVKNKTQLGIAPFL